MPVRTSVAARSAELSQNKPYHLNRPPTAPLVASVNKPAAPTVPLRLLPDLPNNTTSSNGIPIVSRAEMQAVKAAESQAKTGKQKKASITKLDDQRRKRNSEKAHKIIRRVAIGTVAAAILSGAVYVTGFTPYFELNSKRITVEAPKDSLVDKAEVKLIAKDFAGTNLVFLRPGEIRTAVSAIPAVKDVRVQRSWPDGLHITVESRTPAAAVEKGKKFILVDEEGVKLGEAKVRGDLPKLVAALDDPAVIAEALRIYNELPEQFTSQLRHITAKSHDNVTTTLTSGQIIQWGSSEQLKLKSAVALALLEATPHTRYFDVSSPALPVTR